MIGALRKAPGSFLLLLLGCCLLLASCAPIVVQESLDDYEETLEQLVQRLIEDPDGVDTLRELGVIFVRTSLFDSASVYLERAYALDPDDPETLFHLGLTREKLGQPQAALEVYERYVDVSPLSRYRKPMQGRYRWLRREGARDEMLRILTIEEQLGSDDLSPDVVAVFPLTYRGREERFSALGRGLAEMIGIDLSQVGRLTVVERVRLQALIDELKLAQSDYVDTTTAPRTGKLLRAGRVLAGSFNVLDEENLLLDMLFWEAQLPTPPEPETHTEALSNFFTLEKRIVFDLIDDMGIALTQAERQRIEFVPTHSFQAFLAYSQGLVLEDDGDYEGAARRYREASLFDPGFQAVIDHLESTEGLGAAQGTIDEVFETTFGVAPPTTSSAELLGDRLGNLGLVTGTGSAPTSEEQSEGATGRVPREPAEDAASVVRSLPVPPPPPPPRSGGNR